MHGIANTVPGTWYHQVVYRDMLLHLDDNDCDRVYRCDVTYTYMYIVLLTRLSGGIGCVHSCIYFKGIRAIHKIYSYLQVLPVVVVSKV